MPFFSVIIPVYGVEPWLRECVDSVLEQSFPDFELILVDDGSPDNCPAICDEYAAKDGRVKVLHQPNRGVAAARNHGLEAASGEMVLFMDSDDYWCRDTMLAEIHQICKEEPAVDAVYFKDQHLLPDGQIIDRPFPSDWNFNAMTPLEQFRAMVATDTFLGAPCMKAIRREFLISRKIRFPENLWAEDILWDTELAACLPANRILNEYCYMIRIREGSRSRCNSEKQMREYLEIVDRCMAITSPDTQAQFAARSYGAYHFLIWCAKLAQLAPRDRAELLAAARAREGYLSYDLNGKVRLAGRVRRLLGLRGMIWLLGKYLEIRA